LKLLFRPEQRVLHVGQFCSAWTNAARALNPDLQILETEAGIPVDAMRRARKLGQIDHLVVEDAAMLSAVISGAALSLHHARIDMLHFALSENLALTESLWRDFGYRLFRFDDGRLETADHAAALQPGRYVLIQERLAPAALGQAAQELDVPALCREHGIAVRGVIHVGAHEGREIAVYDRLGAERVVFIEANPQVHARLAAAMRTRPGVICVQRALSDRAGILQPHLASFDQSSSLLPLALHRRVYPEIAPAGVVDVPASTLDELMAELNFGETPFELLVVDVQGAEGLVLKGAEKTLRQTRAV
jgi:FkbM family methyltransferase